jgi:hypothetical protein
MRASILRQNETRERLHDQLTSQRLILEHQLNSLRQHIHPEEESAITPLRRIQILSTAELYRLAAHLYLLEVVPSHDDNTVRPAILSLALEALDRLEVATCPWPLFIIACEAIDDNVRVRVLRVLDKMDVSRGIGNVRVMRGIVEAFWKQVDLRADAGSGPGNTGRDPHAQRFSLSWADLVNCDTPVPWFI